MLVGEGNVEKGEVMLVSDLLEEKGSVVATIGAQATVAEVVAELTRHRIGALVVSGDGIHIEGIVSERDIVRHLGGLGADPMSDPVTLIMSRSVRTCSAADDVESIMNVMTEYRIRHVPVVESGRLRGIVSIGDVVKSRVRELEKDRDELMEYITAR
jgi:CBS domain-containing protein